MEATVQLPDALAHRLERLAKEQGTSVDALIRRLVSERLELQESARVGRKEVGLPLIPRRETGVIVPVTGADLDAMFAREDIAS